MKKYSLALLVFVFVFSFFTPNIKNADALDALVPGCNSTSGFSTTTGQPCSTNLPQGCYEGANFSVTTGEPCDPVDFPVSGCHTGAVFSVTTGQPCKGTTPSGVPGCYSTSGYSTTTGAPCDGTTLRIPTVTVTAEPDTIYAGQSSMISWVSSDMYSSCSYWEGSFGDATTKGSQLVYPTETTSYNVSCTNSAGTDLGHVTVTVKNVNGCSSSGYDPRTGLRCGCNSVYGYSTTTGEPCGPQSPTPTSNSVPSVALTANPTSITAGQASTLYLVATGTESCRFTPSAWSNTGIIDAQGILKNYNIVSPTETTTYTATCSNTSGQTTKSVTVTVTQPTTVTPPVTTTSAPTIAPTLTGSAGECGTGRVNLTWTSVPNATEYQIFRGGVSTGVWKTVTGTSYSYVDPVIPQGWRYDVRAVNSAGVGPLSNPTTGVGVSTGVCSTISTPTTPPVTSTPSSAPTTAPTLSGSAGECGTGRVNLTWTAVPNASAYQIFRGGFNTGVWQTVTGTSYNYVDPVIPEGWRYDVRAINSIGNGPLSNPTTGVGVSTALCSTSTTSTTTPTVTLRVNDGVGPITVAPHTSVKISWNSTGSVEGCHLNNVSDQANTANIIPTSGTWYTPGVVVDTSLIINCSNQVKSNAVSIKVSGAVLGASTNLPSGCYPGANYSVITGMSCYAPGCSSYQGYSVTTGKSCSI